MARAGLLLTIFCFCLVSLSSSLRHRLGECPTITGKSELDITKLSGGWIVYAKYGYHSYHVVPRCNWFIFNTAERDKIATVVEKKVFRKFAKVKTSELKPETKEVFTKHQVIEESSMSDEIKKKRIFTILETDYNCWAVVYECKQKKTLMVTQSEIRSLLLVRKNAECMKQVYSSTYEEILTKKAELSNPHISWEYTSGC